MARRQANVLRQAQDCESGDPFADGLRRTYAELEAERRSGLERLVELDTADEAAGDTPSTDDVALLDQLPYLVLNLERAPQELLRPLFEILDLRIQLHLDSDAVTLTITLPARMTADLAEAAGRIEEVVPPAARQSCGKGAGARAVAGGAPNGIRTRATALKGRRPGPLDDEG